MPVADCGCVGNRRRRRRRHGRGIRLKTLGAMEPARLITLAASSPGGPRASSCSKLESSLLVPSVGTKTVRVVQRQVASGQTVKLRLSANPDQNFGRLAP